MNNRSVSNSLLSEPAPKLKVLPTQKTHKDLSDGKLSALQNWSYTFLPYLWPFTQSKGMNHPRLFAPISGEKIQKKKHEKLYFVQWLVSNPWKNRPIKTQRQPIHNYELHLPMGTRCSWVVDYQSERISVDVSFAPGRSKQQNQQATLLEKLRVCQEDTPANCGPKTITFTKLNGDERKSEHGWTVSSTVPSIRNHLLTNRLVIPIVNFFQIPLNLITHSLCRNSIINNCFQTVLSDVGCCGWWSRRVPRRVHERRILQTLAKRWRPGNKKSKYYHR